MKKKTTFSHNGKNNNAKTTTKNRSDESTGFRKLFIDELKDIYWAEKALVKALPKMIKKVTSAELAEALQEHTTETETQVSRLEELFVSIGEKAVARKCEAMVGLIEESERIIDETEEGPVRDAGIISAAQKIEHYEIATYGTLCSFAKTLQEAESESILEEILNEEKEADKKLSEIAESLVNVEALQEN